jgi:hypothetical protein
LLPDRTLGFPSAAIAVIVAIPAAVSVLLVAEGMSAGKVARNRERRGNFNAVHLTFIGLYKLSADQNVPEFV